MGRSRFMGSEKGGRSVSNVITKELLRSWGPCVDGYKRFCELFPDGATLTVAIDGLVADGRDDWGWWLFIACRRAGFAEAETARGYRNSGNWNSGDRNSGNRNSGDWNSGNWNSGNENSGNWNSGDGNSGNRNSGDWNSGDGNSGNRNSGNENSGNRNSGNENSGDWNSGDWNSGNRNSGNGNSGDWNSGDGNSGFFNIDTPTVVRVFGRDCERDAWNRVEKPNFLRFSLTEWITSESMTDDEKTRYPWHAVTGGYLRRYAYKEAFRRSWDRADTTDRMKIKDLPNFDAEIFYEISGIDLREKKDGD